VVAGDFNSNTIWDYKRPAGQNHSGLVRQLASLGLVSAYHHFFREAHGAESQPTLYLQRNPLKPYHIDYCFIPEAWRIHLSRVEIGSGDIWAAQSDHRPLVIDVDLPGDSPVSMPNNTLQRSGMNVRCEPRGSWPADERQR
jgi:endonuclease/exonuclease/phosphatase family metal-dependent hydrolase